MRSTPFTTCKRQRKNIKVDREISRVDNSFFVTTKVVVRNATLFYLRIYIALRAFADKNRICNSYNISTNLHPGVFNPTAHWLSALHAVTNRQRIRTVLHLLPHKQSLFSIQFSIDSPYVRSWQYGNIRAK